MTNFRESAILNNLLVTLWSDDIGQTVAGAVEAVAVKVIGVGAEDVAHALLAASVDGVAEEAGLAELAAVADGVEEALEALAGVRVAVAGVLVVPVVAAVAGHAAAAGDFGVAVVVVGAEIAPGAWYIEAILNDIFLGEKSISDYCFLSYTH